MSEKMLSKGRIHQKARTRTKILNAAKEMMHLKTSITLEDVAKKADISRATIYRYYASIDLLFTEASLDIHHKSPQELLEEVIDRPLAERIFHIQYHYNKLAQKHEVLFRRYLSAVLSESITSKEKLRGGRRVNALIKALEPIQNEISGETYKKLVVSASVLMGIDSLVVCKDVCDLSNREAMSTLKWALEMILRGISLEENVNFKF